jgi:hypothetical protein
MVLLLGGLGDIFITLKNIFYGITFGSSNQGIQCKENQAHQGEL